MKKCTFSLTVVLCCLYVLTNLAPAASRKPLHFPDVMAYQTLVCDFHTHTVFSDGQVWPTVRVKEAWQRGLDVLSLSDHIEYQPHKDDIPTNHNRSHNIAQSLAQEMNILMPRGSEITRNTPPGHFNAIFLSDSAVLDTNDFLAAMRSARQQEAFIFWNHPDWKPKKKGWFDIHTTLFEQGLLHGIEVANGNAYSENAHRWCMEKNLTMLGNSDLHAPESDLPYTADKHRTLTLVLATDKTLTALKEALFAGRTVVWLQNQLIGRKEYLEALLDESITVTRPHLRRDNKEKNQSTVWFEVANTCPVTFHLQRTGKTGPGKVTLPAYATTLVKLTVPMDAYYVELAYTVTNALIAPGQGLPVHAVLPVK